MYAPRPVWTPRAKPQGLAWQDYAWMPLTIPAFLFVLVVIGGANLVEASVTSFFSRVERLHSLWVSERP